MGSIHVIRCRTFGATKYCKVFPTPSKFMMSASGDARRSAPGDRARKRRAKDRRDAVQGAKDHANPAMLSDRLWDQVPVSVNSSSHDNRLGRSSR